MRSLKVILILMPLLCCSLPSHANQCNIESASYEQLIENIADVDLDEDCQAYNIFKAAAMVEIDLKINPREYAKKIQTAIARYEKNPIGSERLFLVLQQKWFQTSATLLLLRARNNILHESLKIGGITLATTGALLALPFRKWSLKTIRAIKEIALNRLYPYRFLIFGGTSIYTQSRAENSKLAELDKDIRGTLLKSPYDYLLRADPTPERPIDQILSREFYEEFLAIGVVGVAAGTFVGHFVTKFGTKKIPHTWLDYSQKLSVSPQTRKVLDKILGNKFAGAAKPAALIGLAATFAFTHYSTDAVQDYQAWRRQEDIKEMLSSKIVTIENLIAQGKTFEAWKILEEIRSQAAIYRALFINHVLTDIVEEVESQFDSIKSQMAPCADSQDENDLYKKKLDEKQLKKFAKNLQRIAHNNKTYLDQSARIMIWLDQKLKGLNADFVTGFRLDLSRNLQLDQEMINPSIIYKQYAPILSEYLSGLNCIPPISPEEWVTIH